MNLSRNFTFEELTYSRIAVENGLENVPNPQALQALKNLITDLLQPLRNRYGSAIAITSGYRNETVNLLAGGVKNSQHTKRSGRLLHRRRAGKAAGSTERIRPAFRPRQSSTAAKSSSTCLIAKGLTAGRYFTDK